MTVHQMSKHQERLVGISVTNLTQSPHVDNPEDAIYHFDMGVYHKISYVIDDDASEVAEVYILDWGIGRSPVCFVPMALEAVLETEPAPFVPSGNSVKDDEMLANSKASFRQVSKAILKLQDGTEVFGALMLNFDDATREYFDILDKWQEYKLD